MDKNLEKWNILALRHDDLKYILLKYTDSLGAALKPVQEQYTDVKRKLRRLDKHMEKTGRYLWDDHGEPYLDEG
jgi:hypothetical protein